MRIYFLAKWGWVFTWGIFSTLVVEVSAFTLLNILNNAVESSQF